MRQDTGAAAGVVRPCKGSEAAREQTRLGPSQAAGSASQPSLPLFLEPLREASMRGICRISPQRGFNKQGRLQSPGVGPPSSLLSFVPVPVSKSQGLGVGGGDDETDSRGGQLLPSAVRQLPALPVVLLQRVAVAPRDQALGGTDPAFQTSPRLSVCPVALLTLRPGGGGLSLPLRQVTELDGTSTQGTPGRQLSSDLFTLHFCFSEKVSRNSG